MAAHRHRRDFGRSRTSPRQWPRQRIFIGVLLCLLAGLAPTFWVARSWSSWHNAAPLAGLGALSLCYLFSEVRLKRSVYFSVEDALLLLALLIGGPVPAFLIFLVPDLIARLAFRRMPAWSANAWATYASYGWAVLAGAALLTLGHVHGPTVSAVPALAVAGPVLLFVNWFIARALSATIRQRMRLRTLLRDEFLAVLPTEFCVLLIAAAVAALVPIIGFGVLYVLAPIVLVPRVLLPWLAKSRDISRLNHADATIIYTRALAAHLGARRSERRITLAAAALLARANTAASTAPRSETGWTLNNSGVHLPPAPVGLRIPDRDLAEAWRAALHTPERWDGTGLPAGLPARMIPKESRLLAVAAAWATLTASGGPKLTQAEAMLSLETEAATRFDPQIVAAAGEIISTEAQFADLEAFQPKLGLLPIPSAVRTGLLPWALRAYAV